jgi:hypothetical protein
MINALVKRLDRIEERSGRGEGAILVCFPDSWELALTQAFDRAQDRGDQKRAMAICAEANGMTIPQWGISRLIVVRLRSDGLQ